MAVPRRLALASLLSLAFAGQALADRLVTSDGRVIEVQKARQLENGDYLLVFRSTEVVCPARFVASVEIEGDMSDYVPRDAKEEKMLAKGYVRYNGRWMSKPAYEAELAKETEARRLRTEELALHSKFRNGYTKETKHFQFKTNTSPELLDFYADLLEAYYDIMDKRVGIKPTPKLSRTKMRINIYRSRDDWERNNEAGMRGSVVGYFSFRDESLNFFHDYQDPEFTLWVALHECTHLLTYLIEPQSWPRIWVNEGVADYFGSSDVTRDKKGRIHIEPGKLQVDRILTVQQAIKDDTFVHLEDLFQVEKSNFTAFEYAHAWSFVYFLNNTKKYQKGFKKFFKEFYTVPNSVEYTWEPFPNVQGTAKIIPADEVRRILLKALKVKDVAKLEEEWLAFVEGIELDSATARFKRAYRKVLQAAIDDFDQAKEDLDAAIDAGLEDSRAYWARAMVKAFKDGFSSASADLRKAVELAPLNARYRHDLGMAISGAGLSFGFITVSFGDDSMDKTLEKLDETALHEAEEQLALACELAPDNGDYQEDLADFRSSRARIGK
ncbi:MAG TPA: DUF1570 domain-containing protein [Planctomycetes bacterium]|nr:DUF1570 domain-containing protein [Planctomycetota bacterium]